MSPTLCCPHAQKVKQGSPPPPLPSSAVPSACLPGTHLPTERGRPPGSVTQLPFSKPPRVGPPFTSPEHHSCYSEHVLTRRPRAAKAPGSEPRRPPSWLSCSILSLPLCPPLRVQPPFCPQAFAHAPPAAWTACLSWPDAPLSLLHACFGPPRSPRPPAGCSIPEHHSLLFY